MVTAPVPLRRLHFLRVAHEQLDIAGAYAFPVQFKRPLGLGLTLEHHKSLSRVLAVSLIDDLDAVLGDFEIFKKLLHLSFTRLIGESATTEDALLLGVETLFEEGVDWVVGLAGLEEVALAGV